MGFSFSSLNQPDLAWDLTLVLIPLKNHFSAYLKLLAMFSSQPESTSKLSAVWIFWFSNPLNWLPNVSNGLPSDFLMLKIIGWKISFFSREKTKSVLGNSRFPKIISRSAHTGVLTMLAVPSFIKAMLFFESCISLETKPNKQTYGLRRTRMQRFHSSQLNQMVQVRIC